MAHTVEYDVILCSSSDRFLLFTFQTKNTKWKEHIDEMKKTYVIIIITGRYINDFFFKEPNLNHLLASATISIFFS